MKKLLATLLTLALLVGAGISAFAWSPEDCPNPNCPNGGVCSGVCTGQGGHRMAGKHGGRGNGVKATATKAQANSVTTTSASTVSADTTAFVCPNENCPNGGACAGECIYGGNGPQDGTGQHHGGGNGGGKGACNNSGSGVQSGGRGRHGR